MSLTTGENAPLESNHFATDENPNHKLKWQAHLEFTQNQDLGELTWDKVHQVIHVHVFNAHMLIWVC